MANKTHFSLIIIAVLLIAYFGLDFKPNQSATNPESTEKSPTQPTATFAETAHATEKASLESNTTRPPKAQASTGIEQIAQAYQQKQSNVQVQASGVVKAVLADDVDGSRHQKFILLLNNGLTILVAHNIDLAPRIQHLKKGDHVEFLGEYEYSEKGGVMHWTHHDPQGQHVAGWLKHQGQIYQ